MATVSAYEIPARTRIMAVFSIPEIFGNHIRGAKPDASDVARQLIGVLTHHPNGIGAVGLEDVHRPRRANAVLMQEDIADQLRGKRSPDPLLPLMI